MEPLHSIATTAIAAYTVHRAFNSTRYSPSEDTPSPQFACYLTKQADEWKCKLFYNWKEACKFALNGGDRVAFKFVRVSPWLPKPILMSILKHNLSLPIHTIYDDNDDIVSKK